MTKSLLYRVFGVGKIPELLDAQLNEEGILLLDEGIKGSVTYLNFRSPGRYANWRRQWYTASIALTQTRMVGLRFSQLIINVPLADERIRKMDFSLETSGALLVAFDAGLFHQDWSGKIEYRFRTTYGQAFLDKLRERTA
ncbi:MAG: hypothetical protein QOJ64_114 [Acidobacteriota bacterium]|jgi:hypothetical protein|nr:hypothetical protein [Acidobacteriota bacterium]